MTAETTVRTATGGDTEAVLVTTPSACATPLVAELEEALT